MGITEYTFDNGLKLVYQRRKSSNLSAISLFCRVGSNYETDGLYGVSHFIEHMLFKGTKNIPEAKDLAKIFDSIGAYFNAYTDKNKTCYVVKASTDNLEKIIITLSDMLCNSLFDNTEFEREKKVVVEEINRAKDNAAGLVNEEIYKLLFKGSRLALPIGSIPKEILNYDRDTTLNYFKNFYKPSNMVFSICTNAKIETVIENINKSYLVTNKFTTFNNKYHDNSSLAEQNNIRIACVNRNELEQTHIAFGFRTCNIYHNDCYTLDILRIILAGNMSSRLFTKLREENGLVYNVSIDSSQYELSGMFTILTSVDKDKLLSYTETDKEKKGALPLIIKTINKIVTDGITDSELEKAKGFLKGAFTLEHEDSVNISDYNGNTVILDKRYLIPIRQLYRLRYENITKEMVNEAISNYLNYNLLSVFLLGNNVESLQETVKIELSKLNSIPSNMNNDVNLFEEINTSDETYDKLKDVIQKLEPDTTSQVTKSEPDTTSQVTKSEPDTTSQVTKSDTTSVKPKAKEEVKPKAKETVSPVNKTIKVQKGKGMNYDNINLIEMLDNSIKQENDENSLDLYEMLNSR